MLAKNPKLLCASCLLAAGLVSSVNTSAQTLYGASNGMSGGAGISNFYTIDAATGNASLVGSIGFENVTGMACLADGRLVASARGDAVVSPGPSAILIEIDPVSGAGSLIGTIGDLNAGDDCGRMPGLTYDGVSGNLYAYGDFCNAGFEGLFTVDPNTGAGTSVGPTGYSGGGNGLAAEPGTGTLYATPFDFGSLITINPVTGAGTDVPGSAGNVPFRVNSLTFDPGSGALYGSWNDSTVSGESYLVTINTADGFTTTVGTTVTNLDAISFPCGPPPPPLIIPTTNKVGLFALAMLMLVFAWVWRRRMGAES